MVANPKYMANSESLEPVNVILLRNSILADMIKDIEMRSSWIPCGLQIKWQCPVRDGGWSYTDSDEETE